MKTAEYRTFNLTRRIVFSAAIAALIIFSTIAGGAFGQDLERSSKTIGDGEKEILKKVRPYPDAPISLQNREECPISIQKAGVKEITNDDFYQLTGVRTDANRYVGFPNVRLTNKTDKRLTGFALFLTDSRTGRINFFKVSRITVEPEGNYSVASNEWVTPEKLVQVTGDGKTVNIKKRLDLDSAKMWLEGTAGDLVLEVVEVVFEDGGMWSRRGSSVASVSRPQYWVKGYPGAANNFTANNIAKSGSLLSKSMRASRARVFECVCSCGADCSGGGTTCTGSCGSCAGNDCQFCMGGCCVAAGQAEGCLN